MSGMFLKSLGLIITYEGQMVKTLTVVVAVDEVSHTTAPLNCNDGY